MRYAGRRGRADDAWSPTPRRALDRAVAGAPAGGTLYVLPTYTAMLGLRETPGAPRGRRRRSGVSGDDDEARALRRSSTRTTTEDLPFWRARRGAPRLAGARPRRGHRPRRHAAGPRRRRGVGARPLAGHARRAGAAPAGRGRRTSPGGSTPCAGDLRDLSTSTAASALVIVAMNTLQVLTEPDDRLACLRAVRDHLAARRRAGLRRRPARRRGDRGLDRAWSAPAGATATPRRA